MTSKFRLLIKIFTALVVMSCSMLFGDGVSIVENTNNNKVTLSYQFKKPTSIVLTNFHGQEKKTFNDLVGRNDMFLDLEDGYWVVTQEGYKTKLAVCLIDSKVPSITIHGRKNVSVPHGKAHFIDYTIYDSNIKEKPIKVYTSTSNGKTWELYKENEENIGKVMIHSKDFKVDDRIYIKIVAEDLVGNSTMLTAPFYIYVQKKKSFFYFQK